MKIFNISKQYGDFLLKIDNLSLPKGNIFGFIGHNGCGKTTLSKIISGISMPDSGNIDYADIDKKGITFVPKKPYMLHSSVFNNLVYPLKLRKIKYDGKLIDYYLGLANLSHMRNKYARDLSSGETQKLGMIRAFIFNPKVIIIDESLSNMDIKSQVVFEEHIQELNKTKNTTFIVISHDLSIIKRLCNSIYFLEKGKIICNGSKDEVFQNNTNSVLAEFLQHMT